MAQNSSWVASNGFLGESNTIYTPTSLKRWSCSDQDLPPLEQIKAIHVYDFDNTLFASPLPNGLIWSPATIGKLQGPNPFVNGGWWHDDTILASTGEGAEIEETRAWHGWWNEDIVKQANASIARPDVLTVLLTGRSEAKFPQLLQRMVASKGLNFAMICLKPQVTPTNVKVASTQHFKTELLRSILYTYAAANEIRIWEDRPGHVKKFQQFFQIFNQEVGSGKTPVKRKKLITNVIPVKSLVTYLDQVLEVSQIQRMINTHNQAVLDGSAPLPATAWQIKPNVAYTAYHIPLASQRDQLRGLVQQPTKRKKDFVYHSSHIVIAPGPVPADRLQMIGGVGHRVRFKAMTIGHWQEKIWAVGVAPEDPSQPIEHDGEVAYVVIGRLKFETLAHARFIKKWKPLPPESQVSFDTVIGERLMLELIPESSPMPNAQPILQRPPGQQPPERKSHNHQTGSKRPRESSDSDVGEFEEASGLDFIALDEGGGGDNGSRPVRNGGHGGHGHRRQQDAKGIPNGPSRGPRSHNDRGRGTRGAPTGPRRGGDHRQGRGGAQDGRHGHDGHRGRGGAVSGGGRGRGRGGTNHNFNHGDGDRRRRHHGGNTYQDLDATQRSGAGGGDGMYDAY